MKLLLLCLIGMAGLSVCAVAGSPQQPVQAFTATLWTATLHSPGGKAFTFMRRTVYTRDASGNVRREIYKPTNGLQHDMTAPLEHVATGSNSAEALPAIRASKETVEEDSNLGTLQFSGVSATGRRQSFRDANGQRTHTVETWFSPKLGLTVHMEIRNARGDTTVSDLSELHLGEPASPSVVTAPVVAPAIPSIILYRGLFTHIAHMERDRLGNDPSLHVNMAEIEDHLRAKMSLSATQWQALVETSVKVENYTREMSKHARVVAEQARTARRDDPFPANTLRHGSATLHQMQMDLNVHVQGQIDELKATVGADAAGRIQAYVQGPIAASISVTPAKLAQSQVKRARKEPLQ